MGLLGWEAELASDQVVTLRVQVLVKDDLIHGLAEILVNLVEVLNGLSWLHRKRLSTLVC